MNFKYKIIIMELIITQSIVIMFFENNFAAVINYLFIIEVIIIIKAKVVNLKITTIFGYFHQYFYST